MEEEREVVISPQLRFDAEETTWYLQNTQVTTQYELQWKSPYIFCAKMSSGRKMWGKC
jgi:hypothetical protein